MKTIFPNQENNNQIYNGQLEGTNRAPSFKVALSQEIISAVYKR
jgi:hypothetical protein